MSPEPVDQASRVGKFIQTYHSFLSTFVIGAAGLIATSIWQFQQSETTRNQAIAQQRVAETSAENSWQITRADILSKNLSILATNGAENVPQRYGVLLSLTVSDLAAFYERLSGVHLFDAYFVNYLPSQLLWGDVLWVGLAAFAMSFLATLYPARQAGRVQPAEALRYE